MKKLAYISLALLLMLSSCGESFLDKKPSTSVDSEDVFTSYDKAYAALIGMYNSYSSYSYDGLYMPMIADLSGEDAIMNSEENYNWFVNVYQMDVLPDYQWTGVPWIAIYKTINDANQIIHNADQAEDASEEQINDLIGQAKVMRAYSFLQLVQLYADAYVVDPSAPGIPLKLTPSKVDTEHEARATIQETYDQILTDLLEAEGMLEYGSDKGFFDKRAAQAILARTYLNMEDWENASKYAKLAYADMALSQGDEYYNGFTYGMRETIFKIAYTNDDNNIFLSVPSFYYPLFGYSSVRVDSEFYNLFNENDMRSYYYAFGGDYRLEDEQGNEFVLDENNYVSWKFGHDGSLGNAELIKIRASEMYLIDAEAQAELGNDAEAQDLLHQVMNRAAPGITRPMMGGQDLVDRILLERRKELFGEGFRMNDIKRTQSPFKREGDHWVKFDFEAGDHDYYRLTYPIPQKEIDTNNKLTEDDQNYGY